MKGRPPCESCIAGRLAAGHRSRVGRPVAGVRPDGSRRDEVTKTEAKDLPRGRRARPTSSASSCSRRQDGSTTARRPEPDPARRRTRSSGARSRSSSSSSCCGSSAWPGIKKGMKPGPSASAPTSTQAEAARTEAEPDPRRVPGAAGRRQGRGGPHHRGGPPDRRRAASATCRRRPRPSIAAQRSKAAADIEAAKAQAVADLRGEVATTRHRCGRAGRRAQPRSRDQHGRWSRATSTRSARTELMAEPATQSDRVEAYAEALFAVARAEGDLDDGRGRAVPVSPAPSRATTSCARRSTDPHIAGRPCASRSSRTCSAARPRDTTANLVGMLVGNGRTRDSRRSSTRWSSAARREADKEVAEVRSAVAARPTTRQPGWPTRSHKATGKYVDVKVIIDDVGQGRPRRPGRRHRHRRLGPPPSRTAPQRPCRREPVVADLTINPDDITAALRKNLEGFSPDMAAAQVGRILEVGDGIARVSGLPDAAVNELLEFEDGTLGPRAQPRRGVDRRRRPRRRPATSRRASRSRPPATSSRSRRRRPARPGRRRARRARSTARARSPTSRPAAWRSRRPASSAASPCTSRCRPASRPSTP